MKIPKFTSARWSKAQDDERKDKKDAPKLAALLYKDPDCRKAVADVLTAVQAVAALGVDVSDWSFKALSEAIQAKYRILEVLKRIDLLIAVLALRTAWDLLVFHTGDLKTADELWPHFYELATHGS